MAAPALAKQDRWLYGPLPDLLLGCGLWYVLVLAIFAGPGDALRSAGGQMLIPFLVLLFSTPHYGATLLRVYERREDRGAYTLFAVHATLLLAGAFVAGVYSPLVGSWLLTIYITWSPWHYTGQNYGIAVMFLRRRRVELGGGVKRWLHASFVLSYALTFLALHSGAEGSFYAPLDFDQTEGYRFLSLGLPFAGAAFSAVLAAYAVCLAVAGAQLLRRASARDLAPVGMLVATQSLWFSVPLILRHWHVQSGVNPWESPHGAYYFLWIAIGHAVQYLWITSWYARAGSGWTGQRRYLAKVMLAGAAVWTVPALLFAPGVLGRVPYDAGLGMLVASVVNLHHFVLDGAIWKLRDGRVARILLRRGDAGDAAPARSASGRLAPAVWAVGALCFALMFGMKWESEFGVRRASARGDLERAVAAIERLTWMGRDSGQLRHQLGNAFARRGRTDEALGAYARALELEPSAITWHAVAELEMGREAWSEAARAYESAIGLGAADERVFYGLGLARLRLDQPARAGDAFERAAEINPERPLNRIMLERARATAGAAGNGPE